MAKRWRVYPFAQQDVETAQKHQLLQVVDPSNVGESVTVRLSDRDAERVYGRLLSQDSPAPFEVQFEDSIVILERAPLPQEVRDKVRKTKVDRSPLISAARPASSPVNFDADLGRAFDFGPDELSDNRSGRLAFSQRIRLLGHTCLLLLVLVAAVGFVVSALYLLGANPGGGLRGRLNVLLLLVFVAIVGLVQELRAIRLLIDVFWPTPSVRTGTLILRTRESVGQIFLGRLWKRMVSKYYFADAKEWSNIPMAVLYEGAGVFARDVEFPVSQQVAQSVPATLQCTVYFSRWGHRLLSVDRLK